MPLVGGTSLPNQRRVLSRDGRRRPVRFDRRPPVHYASATHDGRTFWYSTYLSHSQWERPFYGDIPDFRRPGWILEPQVHFG